MFCWSEIDTWPGPKLYVLLARNRHLARTKALCSDGQKQALGQDQNSMFLWVKKAFHLVRTKIHSADGSRTCYRPGPKLNVLMGQIYDKYIYLLWVLPLNSTQFTEETSYSNRVDQTAGIRGESVLCMYLCIWSVVSLFWLCFPGRPLRIPSPPPNTDKQFQRFLF